MGSDTIYSDTRVCMIGKSHATFVSHSCLQGTVSHIKVLLMSWWSYFRVRWLLQRTCSSTDGGTWRRLFWTTVFSIPREFCACSICKTFSETKILRCQNCCTLFRKNTQHPEAHVATEKYICYWMWNCQRVRPSARCTRLHVWDCVVRTCLEHCKGRFKGFSLWGNSQLIRICI
jgi:hypothetical protein